MKLTISLYIPGLDSNIIEKPKQQHRDSNCYIFSAFLAKLLCMILDICSLGDNLYICYNLCTTHDDNSCAYWGILSARWKSIWLGFCKKHAHHCVINFDFIIRIRHSRRIHCSERQAGVSTPSIWWVQAFRSLLRQSRQGSLNTHQYCYQPFELSACPRRSQ